MATRTDRAHANEARTVTVFGGTGFLGRRIVKRVAQNGFAVRAVSRHPNRVRPQGGNKGIEAVEADILDASSVASAITGSYAVVNAVSLYSEDNVAANGLTCFDELGIRPRSVEEVVRLIEQCS